VRAVNEALPPECFSGMVMIADLLPRLAIRSAAPAQRGAVA
jgi:hypothetical protein